MEALRRRRVVDALVIGDARKQKMGPRQGLKRSVLAAD